MRGGGEVESAAEVGRVVEKLQQALEGQHEAEISFVRDTLKQRCADHAAEMSALGQALPTPSLPLPAHVFPPPHLPSSLSRASHTRSASLLLNAPVLYILIPT